MKSINQSKHIFVLVDFDGVLNNDSTQNLQSVLQFNQINEELYRGDREDWQFHWTWIDPINVANLQTLHLGLLELINTKLTGYSIVYIVSSTWRRTFKPETLTALLRSYGWQGRFFDETKIEPPELGRFRKHRSQEVAEFVQENIGCECNPIFLVLDDLCGIRAATQRFGASILHVQTSEEIGLVQEDVTEALEWIGSLDV